MESRTTAQLQKLEGQLRPLCQVNSSTDPRWVLCHREPDVPTKVFFKAWMGRGFNEHFEEDWFVDVFSCSRIADICHGIPSRIDDFSCLMEPSSDNSNFEIGAYAWMIHQLCLSIIVVLAAPLPAERVDYRILN
jgi:hypothetical protein